MKSAIGENMTPYLTGFGVVMPIAVLSPYYCVKFFGVRNKVLKFFFGVQSVTTFFRCSEGLTEMKCTINVPLEHLLIMHSSIFFIPCNAPMMIAMFGFLPKYVEDSLFNVIIYNIFPVEIKYEACGPLVSYLFISYFIANQMLSSFRLCY